MKESDVLKQIKDYCNTVLKKSVFIWRNNTQGTFIKSSNAYAFHGLPGVPDLVGMTKCGKFIGIEVKRTGEKKGQSEHQKAFEETCKEFNGIYILTDGLTDFISQIGGLK